MKLEFRYYVFKRTDVEAALTEAEKATLEFIGQKIEAQRKFAGKRDFKALVLEDDWPEYDPAVKALQERVDS